MTDRPFVLGLTGSIGTGKSTTAKMFAQLGIPVWDADATVNDLYKQGGDAVEPMRRLAETAVVDGRIDKDQLRQLIAQDPALLKQIEDVVHPLVAAHRAKFLRLNCKAPLVLLDIPLLFEAGTDGLTDAVLVVSIPTDVQRDRVLARGDMSEDMLELILSRQMPDKEKRVRADYVIETTDIEGTRRAVADLVKKLRIDDA